MYGGARMLKLEQVPKAPHGCRADHISASEIAVYENHPDGSLWRKWNMRGDMVTEYSERQRNKVVAFYLPDEVVVSIASKRMLGE